MRKVIGWPIFIIGGVALAAGYVASFGVAIYFEYKGLRYFTDDPNWGTFGQWTWVSGFVAIGAAAAVSLLNLPSAAIMHGGARLLKRDDLRMF